ncbi:hypothetical protein BaRGS_00003894 [Batillaria attramentaria]|uniref:Uncharacterized protein n=1 Tax=Batillaria attramentaria TaxID=370345 RepID=A0ABD0LZI6_9CAEN
MIALTVRTAIRMEYTCATGAPRTGNGPRLVAGSTAATATSPFQRTNTVMVCQCVNAVNVPLISAHLISSVDVFIWTKTVHALQASELTK